MERVALRLIDFPLNAWRGQKVLASWSHDHDVLSRHAWESIELPTPPLNSYAYDGIAFSSGAMHWMNANNWHRCIGRHKGSEDTPPFLDSILRNIPNRLSNNRSIDYYLGVPLTALLSNNRSNDYYLDICFLITNLCIYLHSIFRARAFLVHLLWLAEYCSTVWCAKKFGCFSMCVDAINITFMLLLLLLGYTAWLLQSTHTRRNRLYPLAAWSLQILRNIPFRLSNNPSTDYLALWPRMASLPLQRT
jgi:hypothetical protein